ncbi:MAG: vancomycin resistance protein VanW [Patescibacteria group bacterium]|nr:vancomycin resistance protein VanW [Patescibacteria group bacterium]
MNTGLADKILKIESSRRKAVTKQFPFLLTPVLEIKRFLIKLETSLPKYKLKKEINSSKLYNITEHSSPLYRKYNKRELDEGKIHNIKIAIEKLDGLIIEPDKVFSFWKYVGRSNERRGFKKGLVLSDGKLLEDYGGGLCQLSNLLAYMFACTECDFHERKHHSRDVFPDSGRTIPFASGATVFFNLIDLKVKNTYSFPIKINLRITGTQLRGSISSTEKIDYKIKITEKESLFCKSARSGIVYRYNKLFRSYYKKNTNDKIKEVLLWENIARVIYDESLIQNKIEMV